MSIIIDFCSSCSSKQSRPVRTPRGRGRQGQGQRREVSRWRWERGGGQGESRSDVRAGLGCAASNAQPGAGGGDLCERIVMQRIFLPPVLVGVDEELLLELLISNSVALQDCAPGVEIRAVHRENA
eukprot:746911-Hanusia_phi.AAC.4